MSDPEYLGGCLCGALRYRARGEAIDVGYCHCRVCQRSSGAPVLAWATFRSDDFEYTGGSPEIHRSSERARREFCGACGTQILFVEDGRDRVDFNVASLDRPEQLKPQYHIWTESQIDWFDTRDELPRYPDGGPDAAG
jgi:hypothetical protein